MRRKDMPGYEPGYPMVDGQGNVQVTLDEPVTEGWRTKHLGVIKLHNILFLDTLSPAELEQVEKIIKGKKEIHRGEDVYVLPISGPQYEFEAWIQTEPVCLEFSDAYNSPGEFIHFKSQDALIRPRVTGSPVIVPKGGAINLDIGALLGGKIVEDTEGPAQVRREEAEAAAQECAAGDIGEQRGPDWDLKLQDSDQMYEDRGLSL